MNRILRKIPHNRNAKFNPDSTTMLHTSLWRRTIMQPPSFTNTVHHHCAIQSQYRSFSDNLLGYSPMANTSPIHKNSTTTTTTTTGTTTNTAPKIDSLDNNGGTQTSTAKRDKLAELKLELKYDQGQKKLDDAATDQEKLDLYLIDGIRAVVEIGDNVYNQELFPKTRVLHDFLQSLTTNSNTTNAAAAGKIQMNQNEFESYIIQLKDDISKMKLLLQTATPTESDSSNTLFPSDKANDAKNTHLRYVRDFIQYNLPKNDNDMDNIPLETIQKDLTHPIDASLNYSVEYFRVLLLESFIQNIFFDEITKISNADIDRAATKGITLSSVDSIPLSKLHGLLQAYASGSCQDQIKAWWMMMDKDDDNMLDASEMDFVVNRAIDIVERAFQLFVNDCIDAWPLRKNGLILPSSIDDLPQEDSSSLSSSPTQAGNTIASKEGFYKRWKTNRNEKRMKRIFLKLLDKTIKNHFEIEAESPHRLRCVYAWADKKHQNGKTESVLVDNESFTDGGSSSGSGSGGGGGGIFGGKKRYVELEPKISYQEFHDMQHEQFPHVDRLGQELCQSFKEEILILQGKGRQNQELKRETFAFLVVVSLIDFAITVS